MRRASFVLAACLASSIATASFAADPETVKQTYPVIAANDSQTVVCHFVGFEGALNRKPTCMTKYNWEMARRDAQRETASLQTRSFMH